MSKNPYKWNAVEACASKFLRGKRGKIEKGSKKRGADYALLVPDMYSVYETFDSQLVVTGEAYNAVIANRLCGYEIPKREREKEREKLEDKIRFLELLWDITNTW